MQRLRGLGVSPGVVCGRAVVLIQRAQALRYRLMPGRIEHELGRLEHSRARTREQITEIRARVARRHGSELAAIFDAQLLLLDDPMLVPSAAERVREEGVNAEWAVQQVCDEFSAVLDEVADEYLRERKGDVADLVGRLRMNLRHGVATTRDLLREVDDSSVLIADELPPSLAAQVDWTKVLGFATDAGGRTYHTAIMARSLELPAVVGLRDATRLIQPGQLVVINGTTGAVIIDPDQAVLASIERSAHEHRPAAESDAKRHRAAVTADGVRIRLEANIEFSDELAAARYAGADGIGLYRSEFLLSDGVGRFGEPVDEEQQYDTYRRLVEEMAPGAVTVRTFDVDEEQLVQHTQPSAVADDWIAEQRRGSRHGLRGLRLSLARPEFFRIQIRALLRAARHGTLRIMFPFVSGVEQLRQARRLVAEAAAELSRNGEPIPPVPLGVVIEIPAAAYTADLLAREVDFFTIGTNDLIQYCLAVDREDERVSQLYEPLHPAILRMIVRVRRAAARRHIPVSLCGEMASDPELLALLVGLGLTEFSMTPGAIKMAKRVLGEVRRDELRALARRIMRLSTAEEIGRELHGTFGCLSLIHE